jgi:twitching motility protein PilJ
MNSISPTADGHSFDARTQPPRRAVATAKWNFLANLRLWQKFALLGAFAVAAVAFPYTQFARGAQANIEFTRTELSGIEPTQAAIRLLQLVQQHRGLSVSVLAGLEAQSAPRAAKQAEIDQAFIALGEKLAGVESKAVTTGWASLKQDWKAAAANVTDRTTDSRKSFDEQTALVGKLLVFIESLGDHYLLTLDPTAHTYYLVQAALLQLPALGEQLAQMRGLGAARLADAARLRAGGGTEPAAAAAVTAADRAQIVNLIAQTKTVSQSAYRFINKAIDAEPALRARLEAELAVPQEAAKQLQQLARKELVDTPAPAFDSAAYFRSFTDGMEAQSKFGVRVAEVLQAELTAYADKQRREQLTVSIEILVVALAAAVIATLIVRNITGTVSGLQASVEKVRQGDFEALQAIEAKDEVGDLGRTVNELLQERIGAQKKAEAENETLNNSVVSILQAVYQLSQRDLTAKAPVTEDVIGTVSDSINALTDETSRVLHDVSRIAGQVELASGKVKAQAALVSKTSDDERASVSQMILSLGESTESANQMAALADQSNQRAEQATTATNTALETVNGTVKGMESIRETIAETEKRIKRLGERSQEITGIVNLINTISERTHVLALNASMQAAVAGEAGRGFAVVAEEVQRLAESSRNATQQIGTLVSNIQLETNETINTVNRTITQVVQGSEQAQKAGDQMRVTQGITAELVAQVRRIAEASNAQKATSAQLLRSVQHIGQTNERTAEQIGAQNEETDSLMVSARRLVESVNVFKLPQAA